MGSGKSTVGRLAAAELKMRFIDMDRWIEKKEGCSISEIFSKRGETAFRDLESATVKRLASQRGLVIATGGGVVLRPANVEELGRNGVLVHLRVDAKTAQARTQKSSHRPLLVEGKALDHIETLLKERQPFYDAIPNGVETSGRSLKEVVCDVAQIYRQSQNLSGQT